MRLKFRCAWMSDFVFINQEIHWAFSCKVLIFINFTSAIKPLTNHYFVYKGTCAFARLCDITKGFSRSLAKKICCVSFFTHFESCNMSPFVPPTMKELSIGELTHHRLRKTIWVMTNIFISAS